MLYPRSKIVATIGPACTPEKRLRALLEAGVNVCRLNFSHGTHDDHLAVLERIRRIEAELGRPVAILQDLCGPKIRTSRLPKGAVLLTEGQRVTLVAGLETSDDPERIGVSLPTLADEAEAGQRVLLDDGLIELLVESVHPAEKSLRCRVVYGGTLKDRKGVNFPETKLTVPSLTEKDREDFEWGLRHGVDYVALSFVRHEDDVRPIRERMAGLEQAPRVIAKIEKPEALARLEQIMAAFDGVMVARGDLAVETPLWTVPAQQKRIIRLANLMDRPVITATQMLDSMQEQPRPTRAEVSDVANAIYDGTDAVMLSGETASGRYPIEAVRTMRQIAEHADRDSDQAGSFRHESNVDLSSFGDSICGGAVQVAADLGARCLVTFTDTGRTALYMSKYHPPIPILGVAQDPRTLRRMALYRGVVPIPVVQEVARSEELVAQAEAEIVRRGHGAVGDIAVYVGGSNLALQGNVNSLKVRRIGDAGGL